MEPDELPPTVEPGPSLRDSLSEAYDEAVAPPKVEAPPKESEPTPKVEVPTKVEPKTEVEPPKAEEDPTVKVERPIPPRLKNKLGEKWATLPQELRDEFHGYEAAIGQMASKYGKAAKAWEETQAAFAPYEQMVRAEGGNFHGAITSLFETARILRQGSPEQKVALLQQIKSTFNIPDAGGTSNPEPAVAPSLSPELIDRINRLERGILTREAAETHNTRTKVESDIEAFCADPKHVYIQEPNFLGTMASLIQAGKAENLDDAYTQAAWLHEGPRAVEIAKINAAKVASQASEAARARSAAVSVNGNAPGSVKLDPSKMTLRDTLAAAFDGELS